MYVNIIIYSYKLILFVWSTLNKEKKKKKKSKGIVLQGLFEIFQILEYNFLSEHFQKSISSGVFNSIVSCGM